MISISLFPNRVQSQISFLLRSRCVEIYGGLFLVGYPNTSSNSLSFNISSSQIITYLLLVRRGGLSNQHLQPPTLHIRCAISRGIYRLGGLGFVVCVSRSIVLVIFVTWCSHCARISKYPRIQVADNKALPLVINLSHRYVTRVGAVMGR